MASEIEKYFQPGGRLAKELPQFLPRPQQQAAASAVQDALKTRGGIALIEAGTGVGKTLAYLIPALRRATPSRKVVISTHTLALQGQLAEKDVPLVQSLWTRPLLSSVIKGRGNYFCHMEYDAATGDLFTIGDPQFAEIGRWSRASKTGDVAELPFIYQDWAGIRANADTCKGPDCRFFDRCFYYKMRRTAQEASVLLVNHALFFSDLAMRASGEPDAKLLPDYDFVIFDEAHQLETAAAAAFGVSFSSGRLPGLLDKVRRAARQMDLSMDRLYAIEAQDDALFAPFREVARPEFVVDEALGGESGLQSARSQVQALGLLLDGLGTELLKQDPSGDPTLKDRIDGLRRQCARAKQDLSLLFLHDHANYVRWGSRATGRGRHGPTTTLNWTPVSVAPLLAQALWQQPRTVSAALVSATLSTSGDFTYVRERLGIPADDPAVTETIVGSPFDYASHCLLYIPSYLPPPSDAYDYMIAVAIEIFELALAAQGGAFVLFTSYRALHEVYAHLQATEFPLPLLRQGDMPNARLVQTFRETPNAVLLGTQSFWEGVDVPGESLRMVIIDRIPFAVPDSPLHKARVDEITQTGGDWFRDFAMPQAQLRLKQGFGRLIRTQTDRGVVAILDTRLLRKSYGAEFLRFLPPARRTFELSDVQQFFHSSEAGPCADNSTSS